MSYLPYLTEADKEFEAKMDADAEPEAEAPELNEPQDMAYAIVNAFLDNVTSQSTEAESLIKRVILEKDEVIRPNMLDRIDEVFRPIFFEYPNGLEDRTRARPRDASQYIRNWRDIATWRHKADIVPALRHATEPLAKHQVQSILHHYIENFIRKEANEIQRTQPWNKNKSRAEAMLRRLCGSTMMAKLIWEVGLPNISEVLPATEQQQALKEGVRDSIATATETILNWLGRLANSTQEHKATATYQEHARKSGSQKGRSGLTEDELREKAEKKREARLKYMGWRREPWQAPAPWEWRGDPWQAPAPWQWHGDAWQAPAQWQWHGDTWQ